MFVKQVAKTINPLYIALGAVTAISMLTFVQVAFAEAPVCYGPYGQVITCPIQNKAFTVVKYVKVNDTWQNNLANVTSGQEVNFLVQIENTGEVASVLNVKDVMPNELTVVAVKDHQGKAVSYSVAGNVVSWNTPEVKSKGVVSYFVTTKAINITIAENTEKCGIENVVKIYRNDVLEGQDSAFICVKKSQVQGVQELPQTAAGSIATFGFGIVAILSGLILNNILRIREEMDK